MSGKSSGKNKAKHLNSFAICLAADFQMLGKNSPVFGKNVMNELCDAERTMPPARMQCSKWRVIFTAYNRTKRGNPPNRTL